MGPGDPTSEGSFLLGFGLGKSMVDESKDSGSLLAVVAFLLLEPDL